jgi:hypothetical protein
MLADSYSILRRCDKHFCQLLNVYEASDVRQTEIRIDEPVVPDGSPVDVVVATGKLKTYKSPGIYQIPARLI